MDSFADRIYGSSDASDDMPRFDFFDRFIGDLRELTQ
jgi:hypothetical protein